MTTRKALLAAVNLPAKAAARTSSIPALKCLHLEGTPQGVRVTGTDLYSEAQVYAAGEGSGAACLTAGYLRKLLALLPEGPLTFAPQGPRVEVAAGPHRFLLPDHDPEGFPALPEVSGKPHRLPAAQAAPALRAVLVAASEDEHRPILTGISWDWNASGLRLAATDTHRLHFIDLPFPAPDPAKWIIPSTAARLMLQGLDKETEWQFLANEQHLRVTDGKAIVGTRLIEGTYPPFERVIPADLQIAHSWTVATTELDAALRVLELCAREMRGRISLAGGGDSIALTTDDLREETATSRVDAEILGGPFSISMSCHFLRTALREFAALGAARVRLKMVEELRPMLIEADEYALRTVIMPMTASG